DGTYREISEEGIAGPKRKKSQRGSCTFDGLRENAVDDFVGSPVPSDRDEFAITLLPSRLGEPGCIPRFSALFHINGHFRRPQTLQRGPNQFPALPASCRRIHDCQKGFAHKGSTAGRSIVFPMSSPNSFRLIFMEAVRGKSFCQIR